MSRIAATLLVVCLSFPAFADAPSCRSWPESMALVEFKNAGMITSDDMEGVKTTGTLLAKQWVKHDTYRQVYDLVFHFKSGKTIQVVTSNLSSKEECSAGPVDFYVVSKVIKEP